MNQSKPKNSNFQKPGRIKLVLAFGVLLFCIVIQSFRPADEPILKYPSNFGSRFTIPADNPTTVAGVKLGRHLFYEKALSAGNKLSCESCHEQKLAFTDGRRVSMGVDGNFTSRNAMSLANLLWVRNFFWDGRSSSLEDQAQFPLTDPHEMGQSLSESVQKISRISAYPLLFKQAFGTNQVTETNILKALAQFERTLISAGSDYDKYLAGQYKPTAQQLSGIALFENAPNPTTGKRGANCAHCHGTPKMYKELFHNNGLDADPADRGIEKLTGQQADRGRFRVPTLRNIMLTAPYMHDGRFATIEEVLDHYSDHIQQSPSLSNFLQDISNDKYGTTLALKTEEKKDIIAFLQMLTDSSFINNPAFSNPHARLTSNGQD